MAKVKVGIRLHDARIGEVEALWYDTERWTGFVDGFGAVERTDGDWPEPGARVVWDSRPGGRGRVVEKVASYEPGVRLVSGIEDGELAGTQTVFYEPDEDGVKMTIELDFKRKDTSPLAQVTETLFVRSAVKASLRRTLARFDRELSDDRELSAS